MFRLDSVFADWVLPGQKADRISREGGRGQLMRDKEDKKGTYVSRSRLMLSSEEAQQNDFIFFNNTVLIQGLALTPVIAAAATLKDAVILAIAASIIIIPTRIIGDATVGWIKTRLRIIFYALVAALILIPDMVLLYRWFGSRFIALGLYIPLLAVDGAVTWRASVSQKEGVRHVFRNAFSTALGYSFVICLIGTVREILGKGTVWGLKLLNGAMFPASSIIPGGLLITALFAAFWQGITGFLKKILFAGGKEQ